ncbi:hypothetical protein IMSHALPRED_009946 [Imshaugia aleurites]|uniref:Uncharacterized protein n=1 Tax=Imshaugia aleurites TaxID=172621 RepID=A0A8H3I1A3_9LECA|nr:hypothetical protein IMSHALPRED_009946 [Imshaugia aleurites]
MNLSLAHWTARAFLLFATVAGCLSVYYACSLSRDIGKLYQPELIRDWLSAAPPRGPDETAPGENKERNASISAIFILSAPYTMMSYAIMAFIVGLAIYQGFVWTRNLDTNAGKRNSRDVFIAYIVSTGFCGLFFSSAGVIKAIEGLLLHDRFRTKIGSVVSHRDHAIRHRDAMEPAQLEEYTSENNVAMSTLNAHPTPQQQGAESGSSYEGLAAALEAAAKAHILSAEADRRVASEYAKLSRPPEGSISVE